MCGLRLGAEILTPAMNVFVGKGSIKLRNGGGNYWSNALLFIFHLHAAIRLLNHTNKLLHSDCNTAGWCLVVLQHELFLVWDLMTCIFLKKISFSTCWLGQRVAVILTHVGLDDLGVLLPFNQNPEKDSIWNHLLLFYSFRSGSPLL